MSDFVPASIRPAKAFPVRRGVSSYDASSARSRGSPEDPGGLPAAVPSVRLPDRPCRPGPQALLALYEHEMPNGGVDLHVEHPRPPKPGAYPLAGFYSARVSSSLALQSLGLSPPYTSPCGARFAVRRPVVTSVEEVCRPTVCMRR